MKLPRKAACCHKAFVAFALTTGKTGPSRGRPAPHRRRKLPIMKRERNALPATGHRRHVIPDATSAFAQFKRRRVDTVKETVNGVPKVTTDLRDEHPGVLALPLTCSSGAWKFDENVSKTGARSIQNGDKTDVAADPSVSAAIGARHRATINHVKTPVGSTDFHMTTCFANDGDVSVIEIIDQPRAQYVPDYIAANLPPCAGVPARSVSAPFDDPAKTAARELVRPRPGCNFDVVSISSEDLNHEIDVMQAVDSKTIHASPDAYPDVLMSTIRRATAVTPATNGPDRAWRFTKAGTPGPVTFKPATFKSAQDLAALAPARDITNVTQTQTGDGTGKGLAVYSIDLSQ